jgi:polysaccharide export outer membrane protein
VSAKRQIEAFSEISMTGKQTRKPLTQPIAGLSLLVVCAGALPPSAHAQVPAFTPPAASQRGTSPLPAPPAVKPVPAAPVPTPPSRLQIPATPINVPNTSPAFSPTPTSRPQTRGLPPNAAYTLGPGDRLKMDVFDVPEYTGEYTVLIDGSLNLPILGALSVRGMTLQGASELLRERYGRYLKRPIITLSLVNPRPVTLAVAGEVNRPGTYTVTAGGTTGATSAQFPTVTQALTLAGGITQSAEVRQVIIRRRLTPDSPATEYSVDLWSLLRDGNITQDVILRDGDSIFIPTADQINPGDSRILADASFASKEVKPVNIAIVGEVARPGPYAVSGGSVATGGATGAITGGTTGVGAAAGGDASQPTVTKAIQVAGGITAMANVRSINVRRTSRDGVPKVINVNLWEMLRTGDISQDLILQQGDVITIPTATALDAGEANQLASASFAPNTIVVNVVGEVVRPGAIPVPPNTPLNQAVLAAGGFNVRATKRTVELIRLNPNGSVEKRDVEVDLAQGINDKSNPTLRNNDVVVVRRNTLAVVGDTLGTVLSPVTNFFGLLNIFRR